MGAIAYAFAMRLHNYFRSSASCRVRIALELKGLPYDYIAGRIARGEHKRESYAALSADTQVSLLEVDGQKLSQSMVIIEYLDETHPAPELLHAEFEGLPRTLAVYEVCMALPAFQKAQPSSCPDFEL